MTTLELDFTTQGFTTLLKCTGNTSDCTNIFVWLEIDFKFSDDLQINQIQNTSFQKMH